MDLLLDTHALVWLAAGDRRLGHGVAAALAEPGCAAQVSVVTAWEYTDLKARGRFPAAPDLDQLVADFALGVAGIPVDIWRLAARLPPFHLDPVDRMLIAHAMVGGFVIATADGQISKYDVPVLW